MFFLQPYLLFALPLIGLPILIHLINRQRHRTLPWAAMMFLLDAKKLQRSMAKLRYWLIMAMRMLAIAGLLFAVSRPMASGMLGRTMGSQSDTTILVLDRSPSMEQADPLTGASKRETALSKLAELLQTTGRGTHSVLVESTRCVAEEIDVTQLEQLSDSGATETSADLPRMLQAALDYVVKNEVGKADIWIASDLRDNDWAPDDGRWSALRQGFSEREGIRFHLLNYAQPSDDNLSVSVSNVRKRTIGSNNELVLDIRVRCENPEAGEQTLPLEFVVNGARSVLPIEFSKDEFVLQGHVIPLDASLQSGWGRVEIPGDSNPADNSYYFVFADEPARQIAIVADDLSSGGPLAIAAGAGSDPSLEFLTSSMKSTQVGEIDWEAITLLVWQAALPEGVNADLVSAHLKRGRPVLFFPPVDSNANEFMGLQWSEWVIAKRDAPIGIASMKDDSGLLAKTQSGAALPLGKQETLRYCKLTGTVKSLARFTTGDPFLVQASDTMPAYACTTLPRSDYSSMAKDGVMLYVVTQRAIAEGALRQGDAQSLVTGEEQAGLAAEWSLLSDLPADVTSPARSFFAAAYEHDDKLVSINRSTLEDASPVVQTGRIDAMFEGLDFHQINDQLGQESPLANEVWRVFLALMALGLIVEAALCLG